MPEPRRNSIRRDPALVLAAGAAGVLAAEWGYRTWTSDVWLALQMASAGAALLYAWRGQDRLRLPSLLGVALAFHLGYVALHLATGVEGDIDSRLVFRWQGNAILDGYYPRSEYPPGGVLLFALEALLGGGTTRTANALLMIPFQLAVVAAVFAVRSRFAPWLAAFAATWPVNAFFWEFKYDLVPAALLAAGLVLAARGRDGAAGIALGAGAFVKWTPALAALALLAWLLVRRRRAAAARLVAGAAAASLVPFSLLLAWDADAVAASWERQSGRPITAESLWYLPLRVAGLAEVHGHISFGAGAPSWAKPVAIAVQLLVVAVAVAVAARARSRPGAVAAAAMVPALFLLTNRIFSPQFAIVLVAAWAVAAALVVASRREQLAVAMAAAAATTANVFVYPYALPYYETTWQLASALFFGLALALSFWLLLRARPAL